MLPVDQQMRDDAAFGAAWRRCERALQRERSLRNILPSLVLRWDDWLMMVRPYGVFVERRARGAPEDIQRALTPTAALTALAEALEARQEAER